MSSMFLNKTNINQSDKSSVMTYGHNTQLYEKLPEQKVESFSQTSSISFFFKHSYRDIGRKKFHFCLSFCSVFTVVWSALVINTIVDQGPIIFLKLAEGMNGQYDGILYVDKEFDGLDSYQSSGVFANYSHIQDVTSQKYNLSPRKQFCGLSVGSEYGKMNQLYDDEYMQRYERSFYTSTDGKTRLPPRSEVYKKDRDYSMTGCVMFMDTQRERDIDLGSKYTYDPMNEGECLVS